MKVNYLYQKYPSKGQLTQLCHITGNERQRVISLFCTARKDIKRKGLQSWLTQKGHTLGRTSAFTDGNAGTAEWCMEMLRLSE